MMKGFIRKLLKEGLEQSNIWYHGTPDVTALEKEGGSIKSTVRMVFDPSRIKIIN